MLCGIAESRHDVFATILAAGVLTGRPHS
jgi:hypothetical protein